MGSWPAAHAWPARARFGARRSIRANKHDRERVPGVARSRDALCRRHERIAYLFGDDAERLTPQAWSRRRSLGDRSSSRFEVTA